MGDMTAHSKAKDYVIRVVGDPAQVDTATWNALLASQPSPTPFVRHEYLQALHVSASAVPDTGWAPQWLLVEKGK